MEADRRELVCPACHAPLPERAERETVRCAFCGMSSTPAPQQVIVERVLVHLEETRGSDLVAGGAARALTCPCCKVPLFEGRAEGVTLMGCGRCGGIWVDNASSEEVYRHPASAVSDLAEMAWTKARPSFRPDLRPKDLACPLCDRPLARVRSAGGGAELDQCAPHGIWFDGHELTIVVRERIQQLLDEEARRAALAEQEIEAAAKEASAPDTKALYARGLRVLLGALAGARPPSA